MSSHQPSPGTSADVVIVGGGIAGATAAAVLGRRGMRVTLVDQRPMCPPCFKAEKVEPHQAELLRKFELMDGVLPHTGRIRTILDAKNGRVFKTIPIEQYGVLYHYLVNAVRAQFPPSVGVKVGKVEDITLGPDIQRVTISDGTSITARLVVDACGTSATLGNSLGLSRDTINHEQSIAFGFTVGRADGGPFGFDSVTYYPDTGATRVAYLTLFSIGSAMRANLFVFWGAREAETRNLQRNARESLDRLFPRLVDVIGEFDVTSKVEVGIINLYRTQSYRHPGLVLIGDAFQSVCPTTASGLSKALTDVDVLCYECMPKWFATPGMGPEKIDAFYQNARKQAVDRHSLGSGLYQRQMASDPSLVWTARRARRAWHMEVAGWQYRWAQRSQIRGAGSGAGR